MIQRPIRFRGRTASGTWIFGGASDDKLCIVQGRDFIRVEPDTLTQSTGKFDKLGRELFDGDVVEFRDAGQLLHGIIEWSNDTASCHVSCQLAHNGNFSCGLDHFNLNRMRKIGNIFDNVFKLRLAE